ncbi:hypothetical protein ACFPK1_27565 [Actinomycetospora rhizophila]|uniref:Uncharacterized protein n=1 Tax=Actinomycetospora rhizophila TaxID=1416876 RepID=A0ABV9ZP11_9PSEU
MHPDHEFSPAHATTTTHRSKHDAPSPRRGYVGRLFAAALDGDRIAGEELVDLAPWDPAAADAFEALAVAEFVRDHDGIA